MLLHMYKKKKEEKKSNINPFVAFVLASKTEAIGCTLLIVIIMVISPTKRCTTLWI